MQSRHKKAEMIPGGSALGDVELALRLGGRRGRRLRRSGLHGRLRRGLLLHHENVRPANDTKLGNKRHVQNKKAIQAVRTATGQAARCGAAERPVVH